MDPQLVDFIIVFMLVVASGFFSYSETAITLCESKGTKKLPGLSGKLLEKLIADKARVVTTILLINTLVNVFISSLIGSKFSKYFGDDILIAGLLSTFIILLFGEILPKAAAFAFPESAAARVAVPVYTLEFLLRPLTYLISQVISVFIRKRTGDVSKKNVMELIHDLLSNTSSVVGEKERESLRMIAGVRGLHSLKLSQIMIHRTNVYSIDIKTDITSIIGKILKCNHSRIPLLEGEDIVGILYIKDFFREYIKSNGKITQAQVLKIATKPTFVLENTQLFSQLNRFLEEHRHLIVVIDEYSVYIGIVTLEDIVETIVGSIEDEHDRELDEVVIRGDGSYLLDGETLIIDFTRETGIELPNSYEYSTIANYIIDNIERLPERGEVLQIGDYNFLVKKVQKNSILKVIISEVTNI